jgi:hypothetical protein
MFFIFKRFVILSEEASPPRVGGEGGGADITVAY